MGTLKLQIEEILKEKGISKVHFAEMMGIKKQNVNVLLETNNIKKLEEIATVLGVDLTDLWIDTKTKETNSINGFIEFDNNVYTIKTVDDFNRLVEIISNYNDSNPQRALK